MRFSDTAELYAVAARATATRETVALPALRDFALAVRRMSRDIDAFEDDELWSAFIRRCRRTLRDLSTTPLAPASPVLELLTSIEHLDGLVTRAQGSYPADVVAHAQQCVELLEQTSLVADNPFGDLVIEILRTGVLDASALLIKSRHLAAIGRLVSGPAPGVRVVTESEVGRAVEFESIVVAGPSYWFPPHLLSAPRAETLCFVHYDFLRDSERDTRMFVSSTHAPCVRIRSIAPAQGAADNELDVADLVPTVDWNALANASGGHRRAADQDVEAVPANLFLLADGYCVYLEAGDGPMIDVVVDLEPGNRPRLRSERTRTIDAGDYIVLRSEGGTGDYIPAIADTLLGSRAERLREIQRGWKEPLRRKIRERGFAQVNRDLRGLGVSSPNLRYRIWRNSLRSRDPQDFRLLMEYIGLGDRWGVIWTAMGEIFEAHVQAGQQVRARLEEAVVASDPEQLIRAGRIDVRLTDMDAGTLSVLRVEGRGPAQVAVDEDQLRVMTRVEPDLWQG